MVPSWNYIVPSWNHMVPSKPANLHFLLLKYLRIGFSKNRFHIQHYKNMLIFSSTLKSSKIPTFFLRWNHHYEKSYTGMNVFRKGMNSFRNGMNMFRTGMKTFRIGTGIQGNQNYQKIRKFLGSKNLKEFFQNSNF